MKIKYLIFLIGFGLTSIGLAYMITFLNYIIIGYNFKEYVYFIIRRIEFYYILIGIILMIISVYSKGDNKNDIYSRYNFKS
ncbi:MAG: hypothetical protein II309_05270 [Bacilli bacterium]|jgi:hypothetical protein|nr:hypothetical protein [Bacilli bacterium]